MPGLRGFRPTYLPWSDRETRLIFDRQLIKRAVQEGLPNRSVGGLEPLHGGHASAAWVVDTSEGPVVARVAVRDRGGSRLTNAAAAVAIARDAGVKTPAYLFVTMRHPSLDDFPFSIAEFIPGQSAEAALPRLDTASQRLFFQALGSNLARLHAIDLNAFARNVYGEPPIATWYEMVQERLSALREERVWDSLGMAPVFSKASTRILKQAEEVSPFVSPVLVHDDIYLSNLLIDATGFAGIVDFEQARSWEPVSDFVKPEILVFSNYVTFKDDFLSSYQETIGLPEHFEARLRVAIGLEVLSGLPFFHRWNDQSAFDIYVGVLRRLLEGEWD